MNLHQLRAQGNSIREISRITGYSRNTVKKYLCMQEVPTPKERPKRSSKLDPFKEYVVERMRDGVTNSAVMLRELRARGYQGGSSILRSFMSPLRPPRTAKAVMRYETLPGEQAQVDWGSFLYKSDDGKERRLNVFAMVLSYSRDFYTEVVERTDITTLLRCHINAFEHFGGVPKEILYDNMRTVRVGTGEDGKPKLHPLFIDFALTVGFLPKLCRPYRAQTKGRVERVIGYIKNNFIPGRKFTTIDDLNQQALVWCSEVRERIHGTTRRRPSEMFREEQLQPFIGRERLSVYLSNTRKVSRDGFVQFGGCRYGVPWAYAGQQVVVRQSDGFIEVLHNGSRVALHPESPIPGSTLTLPGQWHELPMGSSRQGCTSVAIQIPSPEVEKCILRLGRAASTVQNDPPSRKKGATVTVQVSQSFHPGTLEGNGGPCYYGVAFTPPQDRATLRSDLSGAGGLAKG